MKIQARKANRRRRTVGYKVGGKWMTRPETVRLAEEGRIDGVRVVRAEHCRYVQAKPGCTKLYDLPEVLV